MDKLNILLSIHKTNASAFTAFALAKEYEKADQLDVARMYYAELNTQYPNDCGFYYHYVHFLLQINEPIEAKQIAEKGLRICKEQKDIHAYNELHNLYLDSFDEAE